MLNETRHPGNEQSARGTFNFLYFIVDSWVLPIEVLLRHSFGPRYISFAQSIFGLFFIFCCAGLYPGEDQRLATVFTWVMAVLLISSGIQAQNKNRGPVHSYFPGISRVPLLTRGKGKRASELIEAVFVAIVAWPIYYVDKPISSYFLIGVLCLVVKAGITKQYVDRRVRDVEDARIESEFIAARLRPHRYR